MKPVRLEIEGLRSFRKKVSIELSDIGLFAPMLIVFTQRTLRYALSASANEHTPNLERSGTGANAVSAAYHNGTCCHAITVRVDIRATAVTFNCANVEHAYDDVRATVPI